MITGKCSKDSLVIPPSRVVLGKKSKYRPPEKRWDATVKALIIGAYGARNLNSEPAEYLVTTLNR